MEEEELLFILIYPMFLLLNALPVNAGSQNVESLASVGTVGRVDLTKGVELAKVMVPEEIPTDEVKDLSKGIVITEEDKAWAESMRSRALNITMESILSKYQELENMRSTRLGGGDTNIDSIEKLKKGEATLKIFVSKSMPLESLRYYYKQASRFGGSIVFKGLPNGSFKELSKLVMEIEKDDQGEGSMQIDDEAFERFGVSSVPVIVLSQEKDCPLNQSCQVVFDKVVGNIGLKRALEMFAQGGDLRKEAMELLKR